MNNFSFYKDGRALYCLFFLGFIFSSSPALATSALRQLQSTIQQNQVHGTITDGINPLPGVNIALKSKIHSGTISDYNGQYTISANSSDTLIVTFIGFKTAFVPIKGQQTLNISLKYDTMSLQEVRVNAGYYSVKESERTGNISRITSKDIEIQPVTNVLATMQGRMAGVSITQTTGIPGGGFEIKIRGQNSIRSEANAPLYIIDGVPYASDPIGHGQVSTLFPTLTSPLNAINPDQIESIEVLKDADATSIYGSRGANGVVLITTKKGKGGKTKVSLNASTGTGKVTKFGKFMNTEQYLAMRRRAYANDRIATYPKSAYDINGTWDQTRYTDWQKEFFGGTSVFTDLQTTVSGGSTATTFLFNGNYHTETTVFPGEFIYKKGGFQSSMNHESENKDFKMQLSASYNLQDNDQPSSDLTSLSRGLPPNAPALYNSDRSLNWAGNTWQNPLRYLAAKFESKSHDFMASTLLSYQLLDGLWIKSSFGYNNLSYLETRTAPSTIYNPRLNYDSSHSSLSVNTTNRSSWIAEPQLSWEIESNNTKLSLLVGATFQNQSTAQLVQTASGFPSNSLIYNLSSASTVRVINDNETLYKYQAFFGRVNYNWKKRYILNITARRDGSSRFGPGNQFAIFGAAGAAWLFSKEAFLNDSPWLSFGKLRLSYGTTGSDQIGDYNFLDTYSISGSLYSGTAGLQPTGLFNPDFAWETNKKLELALETGLFSDRIFLTSAWYRNISSNQLVGIPMPATTGFPSLQSNLRATVENSGFEFTLRTVNFKSDQLNWTSSINLSMAHNKLLSFPGLEGSTYRQRYRINKPLNIVLLYDYTGLDSQTGTYQFRDINKDGRISSPEDKQLVADLNPKYFGGFENSLSYKKCKLDFLLQFVKQKNYNYPISSAGQMYNQPEQMQYSWQQPGDTAPYQIYTAGYNSQAVDAGSQYSESTASIGEASFVRLKNISFSYDLKLPVEHTQCTIMLQAQNLLTFTSYKFGDPEFVSSGFLPPLKIITAGIQLTF